ncbi:unnamed protein product, partial [Closterium sp. NIES-54]
MVHCWQHFPCHPFIVVMPMVQGQRMKQEVQVVNTGAGGAGAGGAGAGGAGASGAGAGGASAGGAGVGGLGGAGAGGPDARRQETLSPQQLREWAVRWGSPGGGAGAAGPGGAGTAAPGGAGARGPTGPVTGDSGGPTTQQQPSVLCHLLSLLPAVTDFPSREPASHPFTLVRTRRAPRARPPPVPGTHIMALRPSSIPQRVVLPLSPASSLPDVPIPESNLACAASLRVTHFLATLVTDLSFASTATSALVTELVDFALACRLDYLANLVTESGFDCSPSIEGELALGCDVLEHRHFELECLAAAAPHLAAMLLSPERDPDALNIPTPRSFAEAISAPREWHDTLRTTLVALGFAPSTADPSLFLRTDPSVPPFYILVYIDDLVFATADTEALALVKVELQKRHTCTDLGELRSYLGLHITWDRAWRTITMTQSHM